jgi:uncharacterized protein HemX
MSTSEMVWGLVILTLVAALGFGIYQVLRVRHAQKTGERSALRDTATHPPRNNR